MRSARSPVQGSQRRGNLRQDASAARMGDGHDEELVSRDFSTAKEGNPVTIGREGGVEGLSVVGQTPAVGAITAHHIYVGAVIGSAFGSVERLRVDDPEAIGRDGCAEGIDAARLDRKSVV